MGASPVSRCNVAPSCSAMRSTKRKPRPRPDALCAGAGAGALARWPSSLTETPASRPVCQTATTTCVPAGVWRSAFSIRLRSASSSNMGWACRTTGLSGCSSDNSCPRSNASCAWDAIRPAATSPSASSRQASWPVPPRCARASSSSCERMFPARNAFASNCARRTGEGSCCAALACKDIAASGVRSSCATSEANARSRRACSCNESTSVLMACTVLENS